MARTYETTGGRAIDIVGDTVIPSNGEAADAHLAKLQKAVSSRFDYPAHELGLFSVVDAKEVGENWRITGWHEGQVKALDDFMRANDLSYPPPDDKPAPLVTNPYEANLEAIPAFLVGSDFQ